MMYSFQFDIIGISDTCEASARVRLVRPWPEAFLRFCNKRQEMIRIHDTFSSASRNDFVSLCPIQSQL